MSVPVHDSLTCVPVCENKIPTAGFARIDRPAAHRLLGVFRAAPATTTARRRLRQKGTRIPRGDARSTYHHDDLRLASQFPHRQKTVHFAL
jgi:hypothetical protein